MLATQETTSANGPRHKHLPPRWRWILAILVVGLVGLAGLKGLADDAATRAHLTSQARSSLAAALQGVAREASTVGVVSTRVAVTDHGRTYYVVDFAAPRNGLLLTFEVERWTLQYLNDDGRDPPFRLDSFTIHQSGWTHAEAAATIAFTGFLGRAQTTHVSTSIRLPRFTSRFGWQPAP